MGTLSREHQTLSKEIETIRQRVIPSWEKEVAAKEEVPVREEVLTWREDLFEMIDRRDYQEAFARAVILKIPQQELLSFLQDFTKTPLERQQITLAGQKLESQGNLEAALLAYVATNAAFLRIRALLRTSRHEEAAELILSEKPSSEFIQSLERRLAGDSTVAPSVLDEFWLQLGLEIPARELAIEEQIDQQLQQGAFIPAVELAIRAKNPTLVALVIARAPTSQRIVVMAQVGQYARRIPKADLRTAFLSLARDYTANNEVDKAIDCLLLADHKGRAVKLALEKKKITRALQLAQELPKQQEEYILMDHLQRMEAEPTPEFTELVQRRREIKKIEKRLQTLRVAAPAPTVTERALAPAQAEPTAEAAPAAITPVARVRERPRAPSPTPTKPTEGEGFSLELILGKRGALIAGIAIVLISIFWLAALFADELAPKTPPHEQFATIIVAGGIFLIGSFVLSWRFRHLEHFQEFAGGLAFLAFGIWYSVELGWLAEFEIEKPIKLNFGMDHDPPLFVTVFLIILAANFVVASYYRSAILASEGMIAGFWLVGFLIVASKSYFGKNNDSTAFIDYSDPFLELGPFSMVIVFLVAVMGFYAYAWLHKRSILALETVFISSIFPFIPNVADRFEEEVASSITVGDATLFGVCFSSIIFLAVLARSEEILGIPIGELATWAAILPLGVYAFNVPLFDGEPAIFLSSQIILVISWILILYRRQSLRANRFPTAILIMNQFAFLYVGLPFLYDPSGFEITFSALFLSLAQLSLIILSLLAYLWSDAKKAFVKKLEKPKDLPADPIERAIAEIWAAHLDIFGTFLVITIMAITASIEEAEKAIFFGETHCVALFILYLSGLLGIYFRERIPIHLRALSFTTIATQMVLLVGLGLISTKEESEYMFLAMIIATPIVIHLLGRVWLEGQERLETAFQTITYIWAAIGVLIAGTKDASWEVYTHEVVSALFVYTLVGFLGGIALHRSFHRFEEYLFPWITALSYSIGVWTGWLEGSGPEHLLVQLGTFATLTAAFVLSRRHSPKAPEAKESSEDMPGRFLLRTSIMAIQLMIFAAVVSSHVDFQILDFMLMNVACIGTHFVSRVRKIIPFDTDAQILLSIAPGISGITLTMLLEKGDLESQFLPLILGAFVPAFLIFSWERQASQADSILHLSASMILSTAYTAYTGRDTELHSDEDSLAKEHVLGGAFLSAFGLAALAVIRMADYEVLSEFEGVLFILGSVLAIYGILAFTKFARSWVGALVIVGDCLVFIRLVMLDFFSDDLILLPIILGVLFLLPGIYVLVIKERREQAFWQLRFTFFAVEGTAAIFLLLKSPFYLTDQIRDEEAMVFGFAILLALIPLATLVLNYLLDRTTDDLLAIGIGWISGIPTLLVVFQADWIDLVQDFWIVDGVLFGFLFIISLWAVAKSDQKNASWLANFSAAEAFCAIRLYGYKSFDRVDDVLADSPGMYGQILALSSLFGIIALLITFQERKTVDTYWKIKPEEASFFNWGIFQLALLAQVFFVPRTDLKNLDLLSVWAALVTGLVVLLAFILLTAISLGDKPKGTGPQLSNSRRRGEEYDYDIAQLATIQPIGFLISGGIILYRLLAEKDAQRTESYGFGSEAKFALFSNLMMLLGLILIIMGIFIEKNLSGDPLSSANITPSSLVIFVLGFLAYPDGPFLVLWGALTVILVLGGFQLWKPYWRFGGLGVMLCILAAVSIGIWQEVEDQVMRVLAYGALGLMLIAVAFLYTYYQQQLLARQRER